MEIHPEKKHFILDQKGVSTSQPILSSQEPWLPAQGEIPSSLAKQNTHMSLPNEEIFLSLFFPNEYFSFFTSEKRKFIEFTTCKSCIEQEAKDRASTRLERKNPHFFIFNNRPNPRTLLWKAAVRLRSQIMIRQPPQRSTRETFCCKGAETSGSKLANQASPPGPTSERSHVSNELFLFPASWMLFHHNSWRRSPIQSLQLLRE